jgi:hypothetical protein
MSSAARAQTGLTLIDLEFDTGATGGALLGDIASSLVSLDELLRDLASIAAYPSSVEFREIQIVAIEMRSPLRITLSLLAISPEAVQAFQEICRGIILFREGRSRRTSLPASEREDVSVRAAMDLSMPTGLRTRITDQEAQRLYSHIVTLQNAEIPLKRVEVKEMQ